MTSVARGGDAEGKGDSATGVTSFCTCCGAKASKGTRKSDADAEPGSRSQHPVRGIVCRPEPTKCSEGY